MKLKELQTEVQDMYMILNDQALNEDFISTLRWEHLEEFIEEVHMIRNMTIIKVQANDVKEYNDSLISYLQIKGTKTARDYFNFKEKQFITDSDYDNDNLLVDCIFNTVVSGYKVNVETAVILLTDTLELTNDIKYLVENYGFSLKIEK